MELTNILRCILTLNIANLFTNADENISCKTKRYSSTEGFHRNVMTEVEVDIKHRTLLDSSQCFIQLIEHIPSGAYVDLYQIKTTTDMKVFSEDAIDVERPEYLSSPHKVHVFSNLTLDGGLYKSSVTLPLHLRYHSPSSPSREAAIHLKHPDVLLRCSKMDTTGTYEAYCDNSGKTMCKWTHLICDKSHLEVLEFKVPVGHLEHKDLVVISTTFCTIATVLWLASRIHSNRLIHNKTD